MSGDTAERKTVWLGAADGLVEVRAGITKLATVPESAVREAVERLNRVPSPTFDVLGPRTDRAARRARQFGRVLG